MVMTLLNQNIFGLMREKADILRYSDLDELEQGTFFSAMRKLGVIIDADFDELNEVKFKNRQVILDEDGRLLKNGVIEWNRQLLSKRLGRATFENEYCLDCDLLPACYGPCSQKMMEFGGTKDEFQRICYRGGVVLILERLMNEYYENELKHKIQTL